MIACLSLIVATGNSAFGSPSSSEASILHAAVNRTLGASTFTITDRSALLSPIGSAPDSWRVFTIGEYQYPDYVLSVSYPDDCMVGFCTKSYFSITDASGSFDISVNSPKGRYRLTPESVGSASGLLYPFDVLRQTGKIVQVGSIVDLELPCPKNPPGDHLPNHDGHLCDVSGIQAAHVVIKDGYIIQITLYSQVPTLGKSYKTAYPPLEPMDLFTITRIGSTTRLTERERSGRLSFPIS